MTNLETYGLIPPQAIDMEEAVLGAVMNEPDSLDEIQDHITPECFYKEAHQIIYSAICELQAANKQIDILTVTQQLRDTGKLEDVGGPLYITQLSSKVSTALHITDHSGIVHQKFIQRELIRYASEISKQSYDDLADPEDMISAANKELEKIMEFAYGKKPIAMFGELLDQSVSEYEERVKDYSENKVYGIPTPLADLTKITGSWQKGALYVIAGRPSMGKTAFALECAKRAAKHNFAVAIFSLEMPGVRLADRYICGEADIDPEEYRSGRFDYFEKIEKAISELEKLGIYIDDNSQITIPYIRSKARLLKKKKRCDMVVIDYLQLIDAPQTRNQNRENIVSDMSRKCKLMAMELDVPVLLLSQLNRACEQRSDKRPQLSDLRESGSIEQDADFVGFLYRPEYYGFASDNQSLKNTGELIVSKQRNGRTGTIEFQYNESLTQIYDIGLQNQIPF